MYCIILCEILYSVSATNSHETSVKILAGWLYKSTESPITSLYSYKGCLTKLFTLGYIISKSILYPFLVALSTYQFVMLYCCWNKQLVHIKSFFHCKLFSTFMNTFLFHILTTVATKIKEQYYVLQCNYQSDVLIPS